MKYFAHTVEGKGEEEWHTLADHLKGTAELAASFTDNQIYSKIFRIAGYLHDLGKYQPAFQRYLKEGGIRGSVPHASWGAGYAALLNLHEVSFAIDGHHKGLPDRSLWKSDVIPYISKSESDFSFIVEEFNRDNNIIKDDFTKQNPSFKNIFERELFTRYLFSSLTDADWLNTEKKCAPELSDSRTDKILNYDEFIAKIEAEINNKSASGELNHLRNITRKQAVSKANMPAGFYSLNLPTGMGKTLTSLSWGIYHAKYNKLKRVIIVLPYINIIDQTAEILKKILGSENVLEHHSGIGEDINITERINDNEYAKRLACENWDYPLIITTTVQFFESIFSNKPSKCRKIHNIANSVVIFDEVQTLPKDIIIPTLTMLENINSVMKTSFLFCTATLPAFEKRDRFHGIESIHPLIDNPKELFSKTKRVTYHPINNYDSIDFNELASVAENQNCSVLAVFNTKKSAREFFLNVSQIDLWINYYHLSTGMCPAHRKEIIRNIKQDLEENRKILVSSTQLIEAGVDFDFPCVFREMAPLESIIQAAGRCNRENRMQNYGKVYLFRITDSAMPDKLYKTSAQFTEEMIKEDPDSLHSHNFYPDYYKKVMNLFVDGDAGKINKSRENFDFVTVNSAYRIIDKAATGLVIYKYNEESKTLIHSIESKKYLSRDDYRKLQVFTVQVYDNFIYQNKNSININSHGLLIWYGSYDKNIGVTAENPESESFVV